MTAELMPYAGGQIEQYQAGIVMTAESAKALDAQVRACTKAVLREGTDYGIIPGTSGDKSLWRPGAQKLLQWFGLSFTCERVEVERDDEGRKHGITYRATIYRRMGDAAPTVLATCEGTADYDESKFYQSAEQVKARLRDQEHKWAAKDRRVPNADRWNNAKEYRADWNALMKRAQKRAIVGAVVDATAAGGIFSDREEDDTATAPQNDGPSWYEQAIGVALASTETEPGGELQALFTGAAQAHKEGLINRRQQDHVQNTVRQRLALLKKAAVVVEAEDLGRQADAQHEDASGPAPSGQPAGHEPAPGPEADRHRQLVGIVQGHFKRLGYTDDEKELRLTHTAKLAGTSDLGSTNDLDEDELSTVADALARCKDRAKLVALLMAGEKPEGSDA